MSDEYTNNDPNAIIVNANIFKPKTNSGYFKISNFRSEIDNRGVLPTHSYIVTLAPFSSRSRTAESLQTFLNNENDTFCLRCDSAILPGVSLLTQDNVRRYGYGPAEYMPHGVQFNDVTLSWIVDARGKINHFFNDWFNNIVNFNSYGGADMQTETDKGSVSFSPYEVGYKDDYSNSLMSVFVYDQTLDTVMEYQMYDVFPRNIMDIPVSWADTDNVMRLSVQFSYTDMKIIRSNTTTYNGLLDKILNKAIMSI